MLEILEFYVSGFWIWVGITIGLVVVSRYLTVLLLGTLCALLRVNFKA